MINLFNLLFGNYIYEEIDGVSISRDKLNFSIFLKNFNGVLLYCVDSNNFFLIELKTHYIHGKSIIIMYNKLFYTTKVTDLNLDSCFKLSNVFLVISLQLKNGEIKMKCDRKTATIKLTQESNYNQFIFYPKPNYDFSIKNKLFLWMGNIGYYIGLNSVHYLPLKNQLIGCVDIFSINDKKIRLKENNGSLLYSCDVNYNEYLCMEGKCINEITSIKVYDCSARFLNVKHCDIKLSRYSSLNRSFINIQKKEGVNYFRIDWRKSHEIKHSLCLMEIKMKKEKYLTFHIDRENYIIMEIIDSHLDQTTSNLSLLVSSTKINTLLIHFYRNSFAIKIYNGEKINVYIFNMSTKFELINVGFYQHRNLYYDFDGGMSIAFSSSYWEPIYDKYVYTTTATVRKIKKLSTVIIAVILVLVLLLILTSFVTCLLKKKAKSNVQPSIHFNRSKTPSPNNYEFESVEVPSHDKIIQETDENNEENCSNYEILQ